MKELRRQLRSRKSRVMELEAEKYFLAGDLHEKSIVETELRDKLAKTEEKVTEAKNNGKRKLWKSQHKTKLANRRIGKDLFYIALDHGDGGCQERGKRGDAQNDIERVGRSHKERMQARH